MSTGEAFLSNQQKLQEFRVVIVITSLNKYVSSLHKFFLFWILLAY